MLPCTIFNPDEILSKMEKKDRRQNKNQLNSNSLKAQQSNLLISCKGIIHLDIDLDVLRGRE